MVLTAGGCTLGSTSGGSTPPAGGGSGDQPPVTTPPAGDNPLPTPAKYVRGSLAPIYQLTPIGEYGRLTEEGVQMSNADFTSNAGNFTTAAQKMDEVAALVARDNGLPSLDLLDKNQGNDRLRAQQIPFRGHPSDVKIFSQLGLHQAYVALGGDVMKPGNEVAIVDLNTNTVQARVKVGLRPERVAIHPGGLVFVCNQFSNYISIIDPTTRDLLKDASQKTIEFKTDFYCEDMVFLPTSLAAADNDKQDLIIANSWHGSVMKYSTQIQRDAMNLITGITFTPSTTDTAENAPTQEIRGVGHNPFRLSVGQDGHTIFVANFRGGQLARVDLTSGSVATLAINGPVPQVVEVDNQLIGLTTTIDRGLPATGDQLPQQINAGPVSVKGIDGAQHIAHPGGLTDHTSAYNFEDLRNGMFTISSRLDSGSDLQYFTDDISPERHFSAQQKILVGSMPQAIVLNHARNQAFVALSGSDQVQVVSIVGGTFRLQKNPAAPVFATGARPFELALDETANKLYVAGWGSEKLEIYDATTGARSAAIDLGYASLPYPGTNIEQGEYLFYNTSWANNGRKSCGQCHWQELLVDGVGFANGATGPNQYHKVPANWNLLTTDNYFWNGSFGNGEYGSLASDAQSRTNCEMILFGEIEGMDSDPNTRIGDPNNKVRSAQDTQCRPQTVDGQVLPANFDAIGLIITADRVVRNTLVQQETQASAIGKPLQFQDISRLVDFYSVAEYRMVPNPLAHAAAKSALDSKTMADIAAGQTLFNSTAGCAGCHTPGDTRHPYTDGKNHGAGTMWVTNFINEYNDDPRLLAALPGGIPQGMLNANVPSPPGTEINIHLDPIDYFIPFCFDLGHCLKFDDPIVVKGTKAEDQRLDALIKVNLAAPDRGFVPGNLPGSPVANTPSIIGNWWQSNYLRHGLAHSIREAILAPGHPALKSGETGFAISRTGAIDVHGATSKLTDDQIEQLFIFVSTL
jgi:YVTN family beta-propeller protein